jgi:uncharacterized protein YlzI (FlbEa/FlbD family)
VIRLTFANGDPFYVNPTFVAFVQNADDERGMSTVNVNGTWWRVRGDANEVIRQLEAR